VTAVPASASSASLLVVAPDEALRRARPLPKPEDMALADLPDDEWDALLEALADR